MNKKPLSFTIGIICLFLFIFNIINHRDAFVIMMSGVAAFVNITIGLNGME